MIWTILLVVALLITLYYVLALLFHWIKYSSTLPLVWLAMPVYLGGVGFLLLVSIAAYVSIP